MLGGIASQPMNVAQIVGKDHLESNARHGIALVAIVAVVACCGNYPGVPVAG